MPPLECVAHVVHAFVQNERDVILEGVHAPHALRSLLNKPEIQPEEIAALPYRTVARAPGVGQRSLEIIRAWLHRHGLELSDVPAAGAPKPGARRDCKLVRTIDYLKAQGYKVTRSG